MPQSRRVADIRRVVAAIEAGINESDELVSQVGLRQRQIDYARAAAETLGWLTSDGHVTNEGRLAIRTIPESRQEAEHFLRAIRTSETIRTIAPGLLTKVAPSRTQLAELIRQRAGLAHDTALHRAGCLLKWREHIDGFGLLAAEAGSVKTQPLLLESSDEQAVPPPRFDTGTHTYKELRDAIRKNPRDVIVITGAGVSKLSGLPLWFELRDILAKELKSQPKAAGTDIVDKLLAEIKSYKDLWLAFRVLKDSLGPRYRQSIVQTLSVPETTPSEIYDLIWSLKIRGVVTFNLDHLAEHSHARIHRYSPSVATGREHSRYARFLHGTSNFVLHPHGAVDDPGSWVFEKEARDELLNSQVYRQFIGSLAMTKTLVIIGFNPRDASFEDHFIHSIRHLGETGHRIFIITAAEDSETLEEYKGWGFRVLQYQAPNHDHSALLEIFREISCFTPDSELPPSAYEGALVSPDDLPPDEELQLQSEELIRRQLTAAVACIVEKYPKSERLQTEAIKSLIAAYPRAVHKAWLVVPGHKSLGRIFGRDVIREISRGAFGMVYEVREPSSGETQACKILLSEVKGDVAFLLGFRRGVASMRILQQRAVSGMVMLKEAFEVPPTIFMEFVDGMTLDVAFHKGYLTSVYSRLRVVHRVAEIVAAGHSLDEVVLHRDIKPANVMLRSPVFGQDDFEVVVLDFDLSWHRGFHDLSVAHNARVLGYAAPEQVVKHDLAPTEKTRNAAVDSFGLGMLVFFVVVGRHPFPGEQQSSGFFEAVLDAAKRLCPARWRSVPYALAELIARCTDHEQSRRPTMSQIVSRLSMLRRTLADDSIPFDCDLALKEVAARAWGDELLRVTGSAEELGSISVSRPGVQAEVRTDVSDEDQPIMRVSFTRTRQEHDDRSTFEKYIRGKAEKCTAALRRHGFVEIEQSLGGGQVVVAGVFAPPDFLDRTITELARMLSTIMHTLTSV